MSIPLGLAILFVLAVFIAGAAAGRTAALRSQRSAAYSSRRLADDAAAVLRALPEAGLILSANSTTLASNPRAAVLIDEYGGLPPVISDAARRVIRSGVSEELEVPSPKGKDRVSVTVARVHAREHDGLALVVLREPPAELGREQVYERLMEVLAHELRTPLTAIMGHVEIMSTCKIDEEELWKRSLRFVAGEVERLAILVEDLLSLSRLDHIPVHFQPVNLRLVAEQAISGLYEQAESQHVTLVLQAPSDLPRTWADADRIRQVFINLLNNAIKYAPGSLVTVQLAAEGGTLEIEVRDTGPGIVAADVPHVFEPFFRGRGAASGADGSGLGLTIVRLILEQHGAPVSVNSPEEHGVSFRFSLPAAGTREN